MPEGQVVGVLVPSRVKFTLSSTWLASRRLGRWRAGVEETEFDCISQRFGAALGAQLLQQVSNVERDSAFAEAQVCGNFLVAVALSEQRQHLALAGGKPNLLVDRAGGIAGGHPGDQQRMGDR